MAAQEGGNPAAVNLHLESGMMGEGSGERDGAMADHSAPSTSMEQVVQEESSAGAGASNNNEGEETPPSTEAHESPEQAAPAPEVMARASPAPEEQVMVEAPPQPSQDDEPSS